MIEKLLSIFFFPMGVFFIFTVSVKKILISINILAKFALGADMMLKSFLVSVLLNFLSGLFGIWPFFALCFKIMANVSKN